VAGTVCGFADAPFKACSARMTDFIPPSPSSRFGGPARFRGRLLLLAAVCGLAGGLAFLVDLPVARLFRGGFLPGDLRRLLDFPEVAAHGLGVACLIVGVAALDPTLWRRATGPWWLPSAPLVRFLGATYAGGVIVNLLKATIIRVRPRAIDLASVDSAFDTFGQAAATAAGATGSDLMSFPSGHSAVAAGFAAALASRYPHATWFFVAVGLGAIAQRLVSSAHYPSDALCGAGLGLLGAALCLGEGGRGPSPPHHERA
jgi:membrane-associated phospholipid phosphatase